MGIFPGGDLPWSASCVESLQFLLSEVNRLSLEFLGNPGAMRCCEHKHQFKLWNEIRMLMLNAWMLNHVDC